MAASLTASCCIVTRLIGTQLAKGRDGYEAGLRQGEAAARRWLAPSPCSRTEMRFVQFTAGERRLFERLDARFVLRRRGQRRTARADARSFDSVRSRAERLATQRSSPPPGGGCGLSHLRAIPESVVRGRSRVALPSVTGRRLRTRTAATDPARSAPRIRRSTRASSPAARRRRP